MLRRVRPLEVCKAASEWLSAIRPQVGIYRSDAWQGPEVVPCGRRRAQRPAHRRNAI